MQLLKDAAAAAITLGLSVLAVLPRAVQTAFFICPAPCQAMYLPIDMDSLDDCLCLTDSLEREAAALLQTNHNLDGAGVLYECPPHSMARVLHPMSFADCQCDDNYIRDESSRRCTEGGFVCYGKYQIKPELEQAQSLSDCICVEPYSKDDATGMCLLTACPRAGNYVQKTTSMTVQTLADCTCTDPLTKNDQSGECVTQDAFQCPSFSSAIPGRQPKSFADCECVWGFVRSENDGEWSCEREGAAYQCPPNSMRRSDLLSVPQSFADCECVHDQTFHRNEITQSCDRFSEAGLPSSAKPVTCPPYSRPLAPIVHSVEQCQCIDGYGFTYPEMVCVRLSPYRCPPHSRKSRRSKKRIEESFEDCTCAKGYFRDEDSASCLQLYLTDGNGCPKRAFLTRWPLQVSSNCRCVHDFNMTSDNVACREPKGSIFQCPINAFLNNWPLASNQDCSCDYGFDREVKSSTCVRVAGQDSIDLASTCEPPMVRSKLSGECRLPVEEVKPLPVSEAANATLTKGHVIFNGIEYTFVLVEHNIMVIQGDVAIGELATTGHLSAQEPVEFTEYILHGYYNDERDHRWKDGTMCYEYAASGMKYRNAIEESMRKISELTGFHFKKCGGGSGGSCSQHKECHDFVSFAETQSHSCFSYIGRIGGKQTLGVSAGCGEGNLMHVLLHAIGLHHTMDRPDRDDHIRIAWECVPEEKRSYFIVENTPENKEKKFVTEVPYDFYSIMHHPSDAFVEGTPEWCRSVFPIISTARDRGIVLANMGQRSKLAVTDVHYVWTIYPFLKNEKTLQEAIDNGLVDVHESRLHTPHDVTGADLDDQAQELNTNHRGTPKRSRVVHVIGTFCVLLAFGATAFFVVLELKKRSLRSREDYYAETLLDKNVYD